MTRLRRAEQPAIGEATLAYAGQHWDADLGLSYAQQRWYEPGSGRFLSEDPVFGDLARPNSARVPSLEEARSDVLNRMAPVRQRQVFEHLLSRLRADEDVKLDAAAK